MALDTAIKRASAFGGWIASRTIYPSPDGAINTADRRHILWGYRNLTTIAPVTIDFPLYLTSTEFNLLYSEYYLTIDAEQSLKLTA